MRSNAVWVLCVLLLLPAALAEAPQEASGDVFPSAFVEQVYENITPATCLVSYANRITNPVTGEINRSNSFALGLIVSPDGLVMVRGHMAIDNVEPFNIQVKVGQGEKDEIEYDATLLDKPEDINVAFLRIEHDEPLTLPHVEFAEGSTLRLGEPVLIFGLLGRSLDYSRGLHLRRIGSILEKPRTTLCLDTPVPLGFVGGPVVNGRGEVVGVVGYDLSQVEGGDVYIRSNHPLVYQTDLFIEYIHNPPEIRTDKDYGWLGVFTQPLADDLAEYWGLEKNGGVVVGTILAGSPAEADGLQRGDVITSFNGIPIRAKKNDEVLGFIKLVRDAGKGQEVLVKFVRNGVPEELAVTLSGRPKTEMEAAKSEDEVFGLTVREITVDVRLALNLSADVQGVIVDRVKSGGWADLARMRRGLIILNFGGYPVTNLEEFQEAATKAAEEKPKEITVFCRLGQATRFFRLEPRWKE